jgi:N-acetylglucosamine-6-sulfatase
MRWRALLLLTVLLTAACTDDKPKLATPSNTPPAKANIVFVLVDDLSSDLVEYMPTFRELAKFGVTFSNYFVTDSLCCPSRASILTGRFPHNTGVFRNTGADGGYLVFRNRGEDKDTFATSFKAAGYRTAFYGKYLNGYTPRNANHTVPPGWDEWAVGGDPPYGGFNYTLNENGRLVDYGDEADDYVTDVLADKALSFIGAAADAKQPFIVEIAPYAPHAPYTPAPRHADRFQDVKAPRTPNFNVPANATTPAWLRTHPPLTPAQVDKIDADYRKRLQSVQAVDDLLARLRKTLTDEGLLDSTYIVFSSDNGYHMGAHRQMPGKMTAFDSDVRVPLMVMGPLLKGGVTVDAIAENIDLRATFEALAGIPTPSTVDGVSLVDVLKGTGSPNRTSALIEHRGPVQAPDDPDNPEDDGANPPTYEAVRTATSLYVEYADGEVEFYDLRSDPFALTNSAARLSPADRARLHDALVASRQCRGAAGCLAAQRMAVP